MSKSANLGVLDPSAPHTFAVPVKKINEGHDVPLFLVSQAYRDIMTFVMQLNHSVFPHSSLDDTGRKTLHISSLQNSSSSFSQTILRLRDLLNNLERIIEEAPPDPGPRRFGNIAFRTWSEKVESRIPDLLEKYIPLDSFLVKPSSSVTAHSELSSYLLGSFGSAQRLDYGTGHELSFLAFLGCIWKLGGFEASPTGEVERQIVLGVIDPYLQLIRRLIKTYTLEPAGSHGVWGLDDHSFLPYVFGSAQYGPAISSSDPTPIEGSLANAPDPADVSKAAAVERERGKNMYFGAIGFIYDVKKGPFWEHSPMLYDISGVRAGWAKINKGMLKMYNAEVLSKFPVVQHFRFGSLFSWERDEEAVAPPASVHANSQPSKSHMSSSTQFPARAPPHPSQAGTMAPWATKTLNTSTAAPRISQITETGAGTKAPWTVPSPATSTTTAAPWAKKPSTQRDTLPPRQPYVGPGGTKSHGGLNQINAHLNMRDKGSEPGELFGSMPPPPTKAPWAKKPD